MFRTKFILTAGVAALAIGATAPAQAAQVFATSYSMPNGDGQASGGTYNYWDASYSGSGSKTTDGAALSGGHGELTDGVVANAIWATVENVAGTGPYVGWYAPVTLNPTITFNFAGNPTIGSIAIQMDNSNFGGVYAPAAILIDGVSKAFTAPAVGTVGVVTLSGLNLTGGSHTVQFQQANRGWTFVSEVSFFSPAGGVPEPATWAMMVTGFGLAGAALRRRNRAALQA
jgi:hypothetical protein